MSLIFLCCWKVTRPPGRTWRAMNLFLFFLLAWHFARSAKFILELRTLLRLAWILWEAVSEDSPTFANTVEQWLYLLKKWLLSISWRKPLIIFVKKRSVTTCWYLLRFDLTAVQMRSATVVWNIPNVKLLLWCLNYHHLHSFNYTMSWRATWKQREKKMVIKPKSWESD